MSKDNFEEGDRIVAVHDGCDGSGCAFSEGDEAVVIQCVGDGVPYIRHSDGRGFFVGQDNWQLATAESKSTPSPELVKLLKVVRVQFTDDALTLSWDDEKSIVARIDAILAEYEATKPVDPDRALAKEVVEKWAKENETGDEWTDLALTAIKAADARRAEKSA